ncbi:hypothetical protein ACO0LB_21100, partial [Undibacterium sp. SXout7W]
TPNEFAGIVAKGAYEDLTKVQQCSNDYDCSKAWTSLLATVIPVDRVLTGVSKISTEVKTLTVVGEDAAVAT